MHLSYKFGFEQYVRTPLLQKPPYRLCKVTNFLILKQVCGNFDPLPTSMLPTYSNEPPDEPKGTAQRLIMGSKELGLNPTATTTTTARETITAAISVPTASSPPQTTNAPAKTTSLTSSSATAVPSHHRDINTGTIIGVSVGSAFIGLAAASILAFYYIRKRNEKRRLELAKNRRSALAHAGISDNHTYRGPGYKSPPPVILVGGPAELVGRSDSAEGPKSVATTGGRSDLEGTFMMCGMTELDGNHAHELHELHGTNDSNIPYVQVSSAEHENQSKEELPRPVLVGGPHTPPVNAPYPEDEPLYGEHSASQMTLTLRELDRPDEVHEGLLGARGSIEEADGSVDRYVDRSEHGRTSSWGSGRPPGWI